MKNILLLVVAMLMLLSVYLVTKEYREQVSQSCGKPTTSEKRVYWFWEWWPNRDDDKGFIACVGPREYIVYRPLDAAAVGLLLSIVIGASAFKKKKS